MKTIRTMLKILLISSLFISNCHHDEDHRSSASYHPALQMLPVPAGLGVNIHFYDGHANDLSMLSESGVGIVRMDVSWGQAEKAPGEYDFSHYDRLIGALEKMQIRLMFIIDYGNPLYDEGMAPYTDAGRAASERFCSALIKRYAGKDIIWELWNEPNFGHFWKPQSDVDAYMKWCQAVVPAIRKADPDACIIGPAVSRIDLPFLESCFRQGLLELVDGVSVHPYRNPRLGPETTFDEYSLLSILIDQYRPIDKAIPIISGEWGYSTTHLSAELQGKYLARQWLFHLAQAIPVSIWYDWHDDGQDPDNAEHNFGTVTWDYQPKDAFIAMKTLAHELEGAVPIGRINIGSLEDYLVLFSKNDEMILALWTTRAPHSVVLDSLLNVSKTVDYLGNKVNLESYSGMMISDQPVYLHLKKPYPSWLQLVYQASRMTPTAAYQFTENFLNQAPDMTSVARILQNIAGETIVERNAIQETICIIAGKLSAQSVYTINMYHRILMGEDLLTTKRAIQKLTSLNSLSSEKWISTFEKTPELLQDVATYYLQMAYQQAENGHLDEAKRLLLKATGTSSNRYLVDRVLEQLNAHGSVFDTTAQRKLAQLSGFINRWWIAGPFPNANHQAETRSYFPEKKLDFNQTQAYDSLEAKWQKVRLDGIYPIIPFSDLFGSKQLAAYAYAEIHRPEAAQLQIKIGSNDGVICWLNGKKIHENLVGRSLVVDEDVVTAQFKPGLNRILLKVLNHGLRWEACVRVCDENGVPLAVSGKR